MDHAAVVRARLEARSRMTLENAYRAAPSCDGLARRESADARADEGEHRPALLDWPRRHASVADRCARPLVPALRGLSLVGIRVVGRAGVASCRGPQLDIAGVLSALARLLLLACPQDRRRSRRS